MDLFTRVSADFTACQTKLEALLHAYFIYPTSVGTLKPQITNTCMCYRPLSKSCNAWDWPAGSLSKALTEKSLSSRRYVYSSNITEPTTQSKTLMQIIDGTGCSKQCVKLAMPAWRIRTCQPNCRSSLAIKACFQLRCRLHTTVWLPHQVEEWASQSWSNFPKTSVVGQIEHGKLLWPLLDNARTKCFPKEDADAWRGGLNAYCGEQTFVTNPYKPLIVVAMAQYVLCIRVGDFPSDSCPFLRPEERCVCKASASAVRTSVNESRIAWHSHRKRGPRSD